VEALFMGIAATSGEERAKLVKQLVTALRVHMELEEQHVYPLLAAEVDADAAEEAEVEHHLARDGLAQLEELTPDEPGFDAALTMVVAGIEHHVQEEEGDAFPRLATQLGLDRMTELALQLSAARAELLEREQRPATARKSTATDKGSRPARPKRPSTRSRTPRAKPRVARIDPDETTKADLLQRAKKAGVSGYSHMSKAELAKAISKAK
jgi:hemerythrin-like domain-containing protein